MVKIIRKMNDNEGRHFIRYNWRCKSSFITLHELWYSGEYRTWSFSLSLFILYEWIILWVTRVFNSSWTAFWPLYRYLRKSWIRLNEWVRPIRQGATVQESGVIFFRFFPSVRFVFKARIKLHQHEHLKVWIRYNYAYKFKLHWNGISVIATYSAGWAEIKTKFLKSTSNSTENLHL